MGLAIDVLRLVAAANVALLAALGWVWWRGYRRHGARHTLGLLVFAGFLLVENLLWLGLYVLHPAFIRWFSGSGGDVQLGVGLLCGLEFVALLALARITWW